jgi:hypothetical protein
VACPPSHSKQRASGFFRGPPLRRPSPLARPFSPRLVVRSAKQLYAKSGRGVEHEGRPSWAVGSGLCTTERYDVAALRCGGLQPGAKRLGCPLSSCGFADSVSRRRCALRGSIKSRVCSKYTDEARSDQRSDLRRTQSMVTITYDFPKLPDVLMSGSREAWSQASVWSHHLTSYLRFGRAELDLGWWEPQPLD